MSKTPLEIMSLALTNAGIKHKAEESDDPDLMDDSIELSKKDGIEYSIQVPNDFSPRGSEYVLSSFDGDVIHYLLETSDINAIVEKIKSLEL